MHRLISVAYSHHPDGGWVPTRSATTPFNKWSCKDHSRHHGHDTMYSDDMLISIATAMYPHYTDPAMVLQDLHNNPNFRNELIDLMRFNDGTRSRRWHTHNRGPHGTDYTHDITYSIKPGWINFNVPKGFAKLAYTAIPKDDKGYPLVPDSAYMQEAVYWYIAMKILYPKYMRGELAQYIYHDAKAQWTNWSNAAYGELMMPNMDGLTSAKHIWVDLYPDQREEQTFYSTTGDYQGVRDGTYTWYHPLHMY